MPDTKTVKMLRRAMCTPRPWFKVNSALDKNTDDEAADVYIYDVIGADFWGDALSAKAFIADVRRIDNKKINLHINSPGGSVYDGFAIYHFLASLKDMTITAYIDGIAASIASVIAMAADKIIIPEAATMMIHDPWGIVMGNAADLRKEAEVLDGMAAQIAGIYVARTGQDENQVKKWMAEETYFVGNDAVANGFAEELVANKQLAACAFNLNLLPGLPPATSGALNQFPAPINMDNVGIAAALRNNINFLQTA